MKWVKHILIGAIVLFAVFYLVTRPEDAASAVAAFFDGVMDILEAIWRFFQSLASN